MPPATGRVFVVGDDAADVGLVCRLLRRTFVHVEAVTETARLLPEFERVLPHVLVLAFKSVDAALGTCLTLYRQSVAIGAHAHRTVLLCGKEELRRAYRLCCDRCFDDYVLFWPLSHDAFRLSMSVQIALRSLTPAHSNAGPTQLAAQSLRIADLEAERARRDAHDMAQSRRRAVHPADVHHGNGARPGAVATSEPQPAAEGVGPSRRDGDAAMEAAAATEPTSGPGSTAQPRSLLLVDDDAFLAKLVTHMLSTTGHRVVTVGTAAEAIAVAAACLPDLVLMDVMLPDMDGIDATRRIKALAGAEAVPVIMLTGHSHKQVIFDSRAAGAVDFVVKPIDRATLLRKIARYLGTGAAPTIDA